MFTLTVVHQQRQCGPPGGSSQSLASVPLAQSVLMQAARRGRSPQLYAWHVACRGCKAGANYRQGQCWPSASLARRLHALGWAAGPGVITPHPYHWQLATLPGGTTVVLTGESVSTTIPSVPALTIE